jgi:hypothetical protein
MADAADFVLVGARSLSTRPSRPVLLTRRHSGRATREPAPRCCREPAAILPTSIAILHRTRRQLSHSRPTPAARPTTLRSRHRLACRAVPAPDAGGLRCRAAGWRACAPARPVYAGKSLPGRVGEAVNPPSSDPVGLRLRGGPAGNRRSARSGGTGTDLRLVEKVLGRSTVGVVACAP